MNKSQSAGMYIVLAIVVLLFVSSVFLSSPTTKVTEISYSNFLERLDKGEFKKIEKADDFLFAIPKIQPEQQTPKTPVPSMDNPFAVPVEKAPALKYKVLTPAFDPDLMKKLAAWDIAYHQKDAPVVDDENPAGEFLIAGQHGCSLACIAETAGHGYEDNLIIGAEQFLPHRSHISGRRL